MTEKTVENVLAEGEAADLANKLDPDEERLDIRDAFNELPATLHGTGFALQPAWEDTVERFGYPPLGVPDVCQFHWADTHAELRAIHKALGLVAKPARPVGRPRKTVTK